MENILHLLLLMIGTPSRRMNHVGQPLEMGHVLWPRLDPNPCQRYPSTDLPKAVPNLDGMIEVPAGTWGLGCELNNDEIGRMVQPVNLTFARGKLYRNSGSTVTQPPIKQTMIFVC